MRAGSALQAKAFADDTLDMMLSDEQARAALEALRSGGLPQGADATRLPDVDPETVRRAIEAAQHAPDVRAERVLEACTRLLTQPIDSRDLAEKVISRIATDALR